MAMSKKMLDREPSEIEMLLPFHAAGTLNARESRRVDEALARDPELARQYAVIREEYAGTIHLNESLGAPSARVTAFFASLSPRTLAWSGSVGAVLLLLQAGVIGAVLVNNQPSTFQTASLSNNAPITRSLGAGAPPSALVRFAPDARAAEITALLDKYQASVVDGPKGGLFQIQFGNRAMTKDEVASVLTKLQSEKIVSLAVAAP